MSCSIVFDERSDLLLLLLKAFLVGRQLRMHPVSHLSPAFPGPLPFDHTDRFEQNFLLDRLGLEVVVSSQVKWFPQLGGQGELKQPPGLSSALSCVLRIEEITK
jgi:hypothetical protein